MDIDALTFKNLVKNNPTIYILDVRTPAEFNSYNIGGHNLPIGNLLQEDFDFSIFNSLDIIIVCSHGLRSKTALKLLQKANNCKVKNLKGGLAAYNKIKD